ncbi:hypothetical protein HQ545_02975 [Candidatus Woesearchaeota archaeon]|nr:hypothetical protein [Candidatus Woesearchaeota archaeon]
MILSEDEAICLVLGLSENREISSITKLNKLLARLNLHLIPVEIDFDLNQYGSFSAELDQLQTNDYYEICPYQYMGRTINRFKLKDAGLDLFNNVVNKKLNKILSEEDKELLRDEIFELSTKPASEISGNEHRKLMVDVDERYKLIHKINEVLVDMSDVYRRINEVSKSTSGGIKLRALIQYCYHLAKFLHKKFERLDENEYDRGAYMFDYYFLYHLHEINGFLNTQITAQEKDYKKINKYYQYLVRSVKDRYSFSIENKDLKDILVR